METWKPFYLGRPIEIHRKWNKRRLNVRFLSILKAQSTIKRNIFAYILVENSSVRFLLKFFFLFHEEITIKISTIPSILIFLPRTKFHCRLEDSIVAILPSFRTTARTWTILNSNDPINNRRCETTECPSLPSSKEVKRFPPTTPASVPCFLSCTVLLNRTGNYTYACSRYAHHTLIHLT